MNCSVNEESSNIRKRLNRLILPEVQCDYHQIKSSYVYN